VNVEPFRILSGVAAPLPLDDVNTDQIIPSAWLKDMKADLAQGLLAYMRQRPDGSRNPDFVLEKPQYRETRILVVGSNFGCGSSREHAVWALRAFGIRCVIARSHAEFFRENCLKNGVLPVTLAEPRMTAFLAAVIQTDGGSMFTVDLESCEIWGPGGYACQFEIAPSEREALLEGLDDIGLTLRHLDTIEAWEARIARERPFLQASIARISAAGNVSKRGA
jgi:3-isopropylmalate/(R)-2-methylmalate dehydratase small subunit